MKAQAMNTNEKKTAVQCEDCESGRWPNGYAEHHR